jgi:hypothetical protein
MERPPAGKVICQKKQAQKRVRAAQTARKLAQSPWGVKFFAGCLFRVLHEITPVFPRLRHFRRTHP